MSVLTDPRFFNFFIMGLYALNSVRWLVEGEGWKAVYWAAALLITASVTFDPR